MKAAVVTGATGLIGSALVNECIANNVRVLAIVRPNTQNLSRLPDSPLLTVIQADLSGLGDGIAQRAGCEWDTFYHLAWNTIEARDRHDLDLQLVNVQYTCDAVRLAKSLGCHRFIGAGSQAEYGSYRQGVLSPNSPANPVDAYSLAKFTAGKASLFLADQLGMEGIWVRVFSVFGPNDRPGSMVQDTIRKLKHAVRPAFTTAAQVWDYVYATDAASAFYLLGASRKRNSLYCLGGGSPRPLVEYILALRDLVSPHADLGFGEIPATGPLVSIAADIGDLVHDVGFSPKVDFQTGIAKILESDSIA